MIYPIVLFGAPVLKKRAQEIEEGDEFVKEFAADLFETMDAAHGVGLASPQVGKSLRMFVVDTSHFEKDEKEFRKVFINPEILEEEGEEWAFEEGCLSIPGIRGDVFRKPVITIRYYDIDWKLHEEKFDGMKARVIQHEYDHIEGKLFTDYLSAFKKRLIKNKLVNISKGKTDAEYRVKTK